MSFHCLIVMVLWLGLAFSVQAATIDVGPDNAIHSPEAVPWASLRPGDRVVVHPGKYHGAVIINAKGTYVKPIVLRGEPGAILDNSILLDGASYFIVDGMAILNARTTPGVVLRHGARFDTIENCTVADSGLGIWIGDGSGGGHRLLNNTLRDNQTHGIAVDMVNAPSGQETLIAGNRVFRNAMHGMEINGNRYIIEHNLVWQNGTGLSGTSGIHVFAKDRRQGMGQFNIIRYNMVSEQRETDGQDGNGVELDQWCDNNQIYFNAMFANDGAGIILFDASHNMVANNTLYDNMRDTGRRHAYKAELVIATDYTKTTDHSIDNVLRNNLIYTIRSGVMNIYVDHFAAASVMEISNNLYFRDANGTDMFFWAGRTGHDIAAWNALKPGGADFSYDPLLPDANNLIPRNGSPVAEAGGAPPGYDLAGIRFVRAPIGAYVPAD